MCHRALLFFIRLTDEFLISMLALNHTQSYSVCMLPAAYLQFMKFIIILCIVDVSWPASAYCIRQIAGVRVFHLSLVDSYQYLMWNPVFYYGHSFNLFYKINITCTNINVMHNKSVPHELKDSVKTVKLKLSYEAISYSCTSCIASLF